MTTYDRHTEAASRSINRQNYLIKSLTSSNNNPDLSIIVVPESSEYLATIYVGTPKIEITIFFDTGSGLNWVKGPPFFDASKSISYRLRSCSIDSCPSRSSCNTKDDVCDFQITYSDGTTSSGIISYEDFGFDYTRTIYNLEFGYATQASSFVAPRNGILALNMGSESFVSQSDIKKFSHCFVFPDGEGSGSRMYFGARAMLANLKTPIIQPPSMKNGYYFVSLDGIGIGDKLVNMAPEAVMIDTGTTFTMLSSKVYEPFKNEIVLRINRTMVDPVSNFDLCFNGSKDEMGDLPDVTFRFANVGVELIKEVVYLQARVGVLCLGFLPSVSDHTTFGNYQMRNMLVGYDLQRMEISFGPANCSTF